MRGEVGAEAGDRRRLILVGAPSGAGKSFFIRRLLAGDWPDLLLPGEYADGSVLHAQVKRLDAKLPDVRLLVLECATHNLEELRGLERWRRMMSLIDRFDEIVIVDLEVPREVVGRQFLRRMFAGKRPAEAASRLFQFSKYRSAMKYLWTQDVERAGSAWRDFGRSLVEAMPGRVRLVRVKRDGMGYIFSPSTLPASPETHVH